MKKAEIKGRWALVTGSSRGIGRQVSLGLAKCGCNVILHSRAVAHTEGLAAELRLAGVQVKQVGCELADAAQVEAMLDILLATGPAIDIVYNNAAIMTPYRSEWLQTPAEDFRNSFEVNVIALVRICHRLIPGMVERRWGRIVNVTSGIANEPELMAYAASKAAVDKFVKDSVVKLKGTGVLMNLMDPGWLRTDLGGPKAPNAVESVVPGALVPVLLDEERAGELFQAQDWAGKEL